MSHTTTREQRRQLQRDNTKLPVTLAPVDPIDWPNVPGNKPYAVWRSRNFLVQEFIESDAIRRLSVARSEIDVKTGRWKDGITWEELQEIKRQTGYGNHMAIEIFPADRNVVNVANMRHLWVLSTPLPIGWNQ